MQDWQPQNRTQHGGRSPWDRRYDAAIKTDPEKKRKARERGRRWAIKKKYGLSEEELTALLDACGMVCEICKQPLALFAEKGENRWRAMSIDHDHSSNAVRGILCNYCNVALGNMQDSPELLRAAAAYLERTIIKLIKTG